MRTARDRIRHAVSFEIIGLLIVVPLGALGLGFHAADLGVIAITASLVATGWNYLYNLLFDRAMRRWRGTVQKTVPIRVLHAVLFEGGLLVVTLPLIALTLGVGLWQALLLDLALVLFYLVYAFVFNWAYDRIFPLPEGA
ncbi:PACE efflux transporter [Pseudoroseicyclus aestuarii]|uniref:Putative membrane protein n=1 Tax=Pseudoroseicyclus aestuarii TaxID=1795041 RepID=A0A318SQZ1_9RHOB|nr:PACE efflux transporter [Pseudoroseicyclus aestuarii]PYE84083.1 putative membrane protein [Pseudoroseicyclus aestuarii]